MMNLVSKVLLILMQSMILLCADFARASTFGQTCSALPIIGSIDYLVQDTAYGFLRNNIDMKTYVTDGCSSGGSEFKFCIKNAIGSPEFCSKKTMRIGEKATLSSMNSNPDIGQNPMLKDIILEVKAIENEVCLMMPTSRGNMPLMCRDGKGEELAQEGEPGVCRSLASSCYDGERKSQSLLGFSGQAVHCIRDTLNKVFYVGDECPRFNDDLTYTALKPFPAFQDAMKMAVRAALILYVILYGFKVVMNGEYIFVDKVFMFVIKFLLVTYFAIGLGESSFESGKEVKHNGMTGYALPILVQFSTDLTDMVFAAGGSKGLCDFDASKYGSDYEFYKVWDAIDCRIGYYLGMQLMYNTGTMLKSISSTIADGFTVGNPADLGDVVEEGVEALLAVGVLSFFPVIFGMFMSGQIVVVFLGILFVVFFISVVLYFITAYLICLITLYVMAYISPIFITMALFERTKGYFDSWLKIVISCTLQPAVIGAFIAIMLTVYDSAIYGNCEFQRHDYTLGDINFSTFELREPTIDVEKCRESLGFKLMKYYLGQGWEQKLTTLFEAPRINDYLNIGLSLIYVMIYVFVFYFFIKSVNEFAADLTGGPSVAAVTISPTSLVDKIKSTAAAAIALASAASKAGIDRDRAKEDLKEAKEKAKEDTSSNEGAGGDKISLDGGGKGGEDFGDKISTGGRTGPGGGIGGDKGGIGGGMSGGSSGGGMSGGSSGGGLSGGGS
jgi:type IV secretion system protein VirB6